MSEIFLRGTKVLLGHSKHKAISTVPFDFAFPSGNLVALVGKNGSGKTSLLRALLNERTLVDGAIQVSSGKTFIDVVSIPRPELPKYFSYVPQEQPFPAFMNVEHFVNLGHLASLGYWGKATEAQRAETTEMLRDLNLTSLAQQRMGSISSGERQRAFLGRALLQRARILLLDEPTNHLDPGGVCEFWDLLERMQRQRSAEFVVVSHDLEFLKAKAKWICALQSGSLIYEGCSQRFFEEDWISKTFTGRWR